MSFPSFFQFHASEYLIDSLGNIVILLYDQESFQNNSTKQCITIIKRTCLLIMQIFIHYFFFIFFIPRLCDFCDRALFICFTSPFSFFVKIFSSRRQASWSRKAPKRIFSSAELKSCFQEYHYFVQIRFCKVYSMNLHDNLVAQTFISRRFSCLLLAITSTRTGTS